MLWRTMRRDYRTKGLASKHTASVQHWRQSSDKSALSFGGLVCKESPGSMNSGLKSEVWGGSPPIFTCYHSQRKCVPEEWAFYFEGRLDYIVRLSQKQKTGIAHAFNPGTWEFRSQPGLQVELHDYIETFYLKHSHKPEMLE